MTIRNRFLITFFVGIGLPFVSCISSGQKILEEMQKHPIVFPGDLYAISNGNNLYPAEVPELGNRLVIYVDSSECNSCFLGHLYDYEIIQSHLTDCLVMIIVSPSNTERAQIVHQLSNLSIAIPVFLDNNHSFIRANPFIPNDRRYQAFFLDKKNTPFIVGDPLYYPRLIQMYNKKKAQFAR